jgi:mono/diheme cytochrome c family protein
MRNTLLAAAFLITAAFFLNFDRIQYPSNNESMVPGDPEFKIPENVSQILNDRCAGCHGSDSKNAKAKLHFKIDDLSDMKVSKLVGKLSKISEVVTKEKMPPKKFLNHYPDKAPTDEQRKTLSEWAESTANSLAGE